MCLFSSFTEETSLRAYCLKWSRWNKCFKVFFTVFHYKTTWWVACRYDHEVHFGSYIDPHIVIWRREYRRPAVKEDGHCPDINYMAIFCIHFIIWICFGLCISISWLQCTRTLINENRENATRRALKYRFCPFFCLFSYITYCFEVCEWIMERCEWLNCTIARYSTVYIIYV